jgi:hypothetical protein
LTRIRAERRPLEREAEVEQLVDRCDDHRGRIDRRRTAGSRRREVAEIEKLHIADDEALAVEKILQRERRRLCRRGHQTNGETDGRPAREP